MRSAAAVGLTFLAFGLGVGFGWWANRDASGEGNQAPRKIPGRADGAHASHFGLPGAGRGREPAEASEAEGGSAATANDLTDHINPHDYVGSHIRLASLLEGASSADIRRMLDETQALPVAQSSRYILLGALATAWAQVDPEAAIGYGLREIGSRRDQATVLAPAFAKLAEVDPSKAEAHLPGVEDPTTRRRMVAQIVGALAGVDPMRAIELARSHGSNETDYQIKVVLGRWAAEDPGSAGRYLESLPAGESRGEAAYAVASAMAQSDAEGALAWADGLDTPADRSRALTAIVEHLVPRDPQNALQLVGSMPAGGRRAEMMGRVARAWAEVELDTALTWAKSLNDGAEKGEVFEGLGMELGRVRPLEALALALELPYPDAQNQLVNSASEALGKAEIKGAAEQVVERLPPGRFKEYAAQQLINRWVELDPEAALEFAAGLTDTAPHIVTDGLDKWADQDIEEATRWVTGLDAPGFKMAAVRRLASTWAEQDPKRAAEFVAEQGGDAIDGEAARLVAHEWGQQDAEEAVAWARGLPDNVRGKALGQTLEVIASTDPTLAASHFEQEIPVEGGAATQPVASGIAGSWARMEPAAAVEWATRLPETVRSGAVASAFDQWAREDSAGASGWLARQPAGPARDDSAERLVSAVQRGDPESAFIWAVSLGDADNRFRLISQVAEHWVKRNAGAAVDAVLATDLTDAQKAEVLEKLE